jgi:hypothetical protein
LVVAKRRAIAAQWNKAEYDAGEACELKLVGVGLGVADLEFIVDVEHEDGRWSPLARLRAQVNDDGSKAVAAWEAPRQLLEAGAASLVAPDGSVLGDARFEDKQQLEGDGPVWVRAQAVGFEGRCLQVVLERETAPGEWTAVGQAASTVRSGTIRSAITPDAGVRAGRG